MYKLRRDRRKEKRQLRRRRVVKLVAVVILVVAMWQAWVRVATIWPWQTGPQADPYKDCVFVDGPNQKNVAEICPD